MEEVKELIDALKRACDLFDKIQERKAVLEADEIIKESSALGGKGKWKH